MGKRREREGEELKVAICDDEERERQTITEFLLRFDPQAEYVCFSSAGELLRACRQEDFSLVLLDIELPELNGFQAACALQKLPHSPLVIFITRSGSYTIQGYEVAFRYLQKPLDYETFQRALSAAAEKLRPQYLPISTPEGTVVLRIGEIRYIEVYNYQVLIHTDQGTYGCRSSLKQLEQSLRDCGFARPHNSYLVNLSAVASAQKNFLLLTDGVKLPISRNRKKEFEQAIFRLLER